MSDPDNTNPVPVDEREFEPFAGEFARHFDEALATPQYIWDGVDGDTSVDFNVWAYAWAEREPVPSWSVVVQQRPPTFLGGPDGEPIWWGVRFTGSTGGAIVAFEMTPGVDEDGVAYVHPNAPRVNFHALPPEAQARVMVAATEGWKLPDGTPLTYDAASSTWTPEGGDGQ